MAGDQNLIGFTFVGSGNPIVQPLDDGVCHRECLNGWENRDRFVLAWNKEAMYSLGTDWFLDVNARGQVSYLSRFDCLLYALRCKRSPFLPKHISLRRPLLKLRLHYGCRTPFTLNYTFSFAHSSPAAREIGVSNGLASTIDQWLADYHALCAVERSATIPVRWEEVSKLGQNIWNRLCNEIGDRYRVVYIDSGRIWEPEDRDESSDVPESASGGVSTM